MQFSFISYIINPVPSTKKKFQLFVCKEISCDVKICGCMYVCIYLCTYIDSINRTCVSIY